MKESFRRGQRKSVMIRNEMANPLYTTQFISALFEEEGGGLFDVRQAILGHLQQGGDPSPFDRIQATRLATRCVAFLSEEADKNSAAGAFIGIQGGQIQIHNLEDMPRMVDAAHMRQKEQWWLELKSLVGELS